ncbi:pyrroline-5-carboxylate reductase [Bacillus sp. FJAT-45350]|uniref:pyrroline-5-carboxylate reductase n=1 Tax=Bacillus sp. FJAT-45350 TaxID=2011014 RepID=UPI000BB70C7C|nr:pyrroline-5-carboxylate reductase [Bacillus sp. FJAT-45350]
MNKQRILFIGAGRMAEAIFSGLLKNKTNIDNIIISNQSDEQRLIDMKGKYDVDTTSDWKSAINHSDVVVLACPPSAHESVLNEMKSLVTNQFIITVAAGMGTERLEAALPDGTPVAWVMPNTSAEIGESMSIYTYGQHATNEHRQILEMILSSIGTYEECKEEQVHLLTAITGSAPAFLYSFCEALEAVAVEYGMTEEKARTLVSQMVYGSGSMLKNGGNPSVLREQVTSPGGATAAGLEQLKNGNFNQLIVEAVKATNARAKELGKGSSEG